MNNVVAVQPRLSVTEAMAERYGMVAKNFEATLRATVVPRETTPEQFAAFLLVCKEYELNPITKEIYAFPTKGGGIQPIVSVDGWANLINSHPAFDGMEFDDTMDEKGNLVAITCRMYRKDRQRPVTATEYMIECRRNTDPWKQWPRRMLRHKAMIQAARYAFGFAGIIEPDEWERSPERPAAAVALPPSPPPAPPAPPAPKVVEVVAEEVEEIAAPDYAALAADIIARMTPENCEEVWEGEVGMLDWPEVQRVELSDAYHAVREPM